MTSPGPTRIERVFEARADPQRMPRAVEGEPGLFVVDATWGKIAPMRLHPEVETVGEREVIDLLHRGVVAVDTRKPEYVADGTLPGATSIPHGEIAERIAELDERGPDRPVLVFCNGPQCTATPQAVEALLDAGFPARRLRYYRGGIHDWMTLGLPVEGTRLDGA